MSNSKKENDVVDKIVRYENGNMDELETIGFFQELINSGLAWELQGHYGRMAQRLLEEGLCEGKQSNSADVDPFGLPAIKQEDEL
jgi:hypothetical protein